MCSFLTRRFVVFLTLCRVSKMEIWCLINLTEIGLYFQFHDLMLGEFSIRSDSDFIHKIRTMLRALRTLI